MKYENFIIQIAGWLLVSIFGGCVFGESLTKGREMKSSDDCIRISLIEEDSNIQKRSQVIARYRSGQGNVVFSATITPGGRKVFTETRWLLVPVGFQRASSCQDKPNPMNYARKGLGTRVSMRGGNEHPFLCTFEREYVIGLEAARFASPEDFVEPIVRMIKFNFDIRPISTDDVVGGGWHEDATNKMYYVIASRVNRNDS